MLKVWNLNSEIGAAQEQDKISPIWVEDQDD